MFVCVKYRTKQKPPTLETWDLESNSFSCALYCPNVLYHFSNKNY